MNVYIVIFGYIFLINLTGFIMMGVDKRKAVKQAFRIPESTLFIIAAIGGSIGSIVGMYVFHHKTRHWQFVYGMPVILVLQLLILIALKLSPIQFLTM